MPSLRHNHKLDLLSIAKYLDIREMRRLCVHTVDSKSIDNNERVQQFARLGGTDSYYELTLLRDTDDRPRLRPLVRTRTAI